MTTNKTKVSILMSAKIDTEQQHSWLKSALYSLEDQIYPFTLVFINDNSSIKHLAQINSKVKAKYYFTEKSKGLANALNLGFRDIDTDLIIRMDADDIAHPQLIYEQVAYMEAHPECEIVGVQISTFGDAKFISSHPRRITRNVAYQNRGHWFLNHPGVCYRKSLIDRMGGYQEVTYNGKTIFGAEDYQLWCRMLNAGVVIHNQPKVLMNYRISPHPDRKVPEWDAALEQIRMTLK